MRESLKDLTLDCLDAYYKNLDDIKEWLNSKFPA
jgi:hypothetical protein